MGVQTPGVWSEVGRLREVVMHRPGDELIRAGSDARVLLDSTTSLSQVQDEHDALVAQLRSHDVGVLLIGELLEETIDHSPVARFQGISRAMAPAWLGPELSAELAVELRGLPAAELARILICGLTFDESPVAPRADSVIGRMSRPADFVIEPLPNLLFTRDASVWVGPRFGIASLSAANRAREALISDLIYAHHPRFIGARRTFESQLAPVEGGDVLLLARGVVAIGVGERTPPAAAETLARSLFADGLAETVLLVPTGQTDAAGHLDIVVGMVDTDAVVLDPRNGDLMAYPLRVRDDGTLVAGEVAPFAEAAATAMGLRRLRIIDATPPAGTQRTGIRRGGQRSLPLAPGVVLSFDHQSDSADLLRRKGIDLVSAAGEALDSKRGGPGVLACPVVRDDPGPAQSP